MTRLDLHSTFVRLFASVDNRLVATEAEVLQAEKDLATTLPRSYFDFLTTYGAVQTPSLLDLVTGGDSEIPPEGASWDIHEFIPASELVQVANNYWSGGMESILVPFALDSGGNVFGFPRGKVESRSDDSAVLFFDNEFVEIHEEALSFDALLLSFVRLHEASADRLANVQALLIDAVHFHVKQDGTVLTLEQNSRGVSWRPITIDRLQRDLTALQDRNIPVACSRDDPDTNSAKLVEMIFRIITGFDVPIQILREPPVPVV
jgi:hypothetical protein